MGSVLEDRKKFVRKSFFERFGSLAIPSCFWCLKKVESMGWDYDHNRDEILVWVECHGDRTEFRQKYDDIMKHNAIKMYRAFAPGQATRVNGKLQAGLDSSKGKRRDTRAPEDISEAEKADILEIKDPNKLSFGFTGSNS